MKTLARVFKPLQQAALAFFSHDVTIQRDADGVRLVLEEVLPEGTPRKPSRKEAAQRAERDELKLVLDELREVLDDATGARTALHHLVFVEHALHKKGMKALHKLPLPVLQRALEQLEHLVTNWSPAGLANLRSKMAVAVIDREHADPEAEADAYRTAALLDLPIPAVLPATAPALAAPSSGPADEATAVDILLDATTDPGLSHQEETDALAAAYAAIGAAMPVDGAPAELEALEYHAELGSAAAKATPRRGPRDTGALPEIRLRELQG
jgi:hypothetical protein